MTRALVFGLLLSALPGASAMAGTLSASALAALDAPSTRVRIAAVIALGESDDPLAGRILVGMLGDKSPAVRATTAASLQKVGNARALRRLKELADGDPNSLVRKKAAAAHRTLAARQSAASAPASRAGPRIGVDLSDLKDLSQSGISGLTQLLQRGVRSAIEQNTRRSWDFSGKDAKRRYGLLLLLRPIKEGRLELAKTFEVRCELTLVALPGKALRLSSSATATTGMEGKIDAATKKELIEDGIGACAPALAKDFLSYALSR